MRQVRRLVLSLGLVAASSAMASAQDVILASGPPPSALSGPATASPAVRPASVRPDRDDLPAAEAPGSVQPQQSSSSSAPGHRRALVKRRLPKLGLLPVPPASFASRPPRGRQVHVRLPRLALLPVASELPALAAPSAPRRTLTLTIAGDLGMGGHLQPVRSDGAARHGGVVPWREWTEKLRPLVDGDLNFANLETAVMTRNDLRPESKTFNFRSHPDGVRHIAGIGINLLSTANNHSMDFGPPGAIETVEHLDRILAEGRLKAHAGLGRNRDEASRAHVVSVGDAKVAFSAVGIVTGGFPLHRAADNRPGQMAYQNPEDFSEVTRRLSEAPAQFRILSVHHGIERQVSTDAIAVRKLRHDAVLGRGVDLVIGHHAHVVQGVEIVNGRVIFYGLGNFLHPGMQNMALMGMCRDYGLFARVHLAADETGHFRIRAIEVIPLTDMHHKVAAMAPAQAAERVQVLNYLASGLDSAATGARGIRFAARPNGTGLFCAEGASGEPGKAGELCRSWRGPDALTQAQHSRVASACGYISQPPAEVARAQQTRPERVAARRQGRPASQPTLFSLFGGN